jgi:hypothetical protein
MSLLCLGNHDDDTPGDLVVSVYDLFDQSAA